MSKELVTTVQGMLKEETWTRATISNYTKNNLSELTTLIEKARAENCTKEIKDLCDEHLTHSKDSIIALYISGILSIGENSLDNSNLTSLVDIFEKAHKEPIVVYLCETVRDIDKNNKFALRTLAKYYKEANDERVWDLYKDLVNIDFEEAECAKALAEHYEAQGDAKNSTEFYKKAILRYVNSKNIGAIKELWTKLINTNNENNPKLIDFYLLVQRKVAKTISEDKSALLMQELYNWYKDHGNENDNWVTAISILKLILSIDPKDPWARREIIDCYRGLYKDHTHLEDYIKSSDLTQSFRNVFEAINDFEKHIAFDVNHFVFHRSWGVGQIVKVENDNLDIYFGKKQGHHVMSLKMAINALTPLSNDHIWVKKATTTNKAELVKWVKENITDTLKTIITSFNNSCDFKRIKAELVPSILTPGEWTSWNSKAKAKLESEEIFGVNPNDISQYIVHEKISKSDKIANEFKAQKQFFNRIDIFMKYVLDEETEKNEQFADMFNYFISFIKTVTKVSEQVMASFLVIRKLQVLNIPQCAYSCKYTFQQLYEDIDDPRKMYEELKDSKNTSLRTDFLEEIRKLPNWADEYIRLFPTVLSEKMLTTLSDNGYSDKLKALVKLAFEDFKDFRNAIIYFFDKCQDKQWFKDSGVSTEKQLITLLNLIELTSTEINNHVNTTENKKINKAAKASLFENDTLANFMFAHDEYMVTKMYTLVDDIADIEHNTKAGLRSKILSHYPDYKFPIKEEKVSAPHGMIVTAKKLEQKKAELEHIQKVEIPKNAKEIEEARAQGDLKENAEYKAAKEYQHVLGDKLNKLQRALDRAVIFDSTTATNAFVSFGTVVTLMNTDTNQKEVYTILGTWEAEDSDSILSYMAPKAEALLNHKVGDKVTYSHNDYVTNYEVLSIELAKID